jgi:hypothetical protein
LNAVHSRINQTQWIKKITTHQIAINVRAHRKKILLLQTTHLLCQECILINIDHVIKIQILRQSPQITNQLRMKKVCCTKRLTPWESQYLIKRCLKEECRYKPYS